MDNSYVVVIESNLGLLSILDMEAFLNVDKEMGASYEGTVAYTGTLKECREFCKI